LVRRWSDPGGDLSLVLLAARDSCQQHLVG
jgi:hypothetical protein